MAEQDRTSAPISPVIQLLTSSATKDPLSRPDTTHQCELNILRRTCSTIYGKFNTDFLSYAGSDAKGKMVIEIESCVRLPENFLGVLIRYT